MNRSGAASLVVSLLACLPIAIPACGGSSAQPMLPLAASASASASAAPVVATEPPDEAIEPLRTGEITPTEAPRTEARLIGHYLDDRFETLALELTLPTT